MKIEQAEIILKKLIGKSIPLENTNKYNKGKFGHSLEKFLQLKLGSHHLDFENGELKSCASKNNKLKEDFKICKKWDKTYIKEKINNMLIVIYDYDTQIILSVKIFNILAHPIVSKQFDLEIDWLLKQIDIRKVSQKDTDVFVAKTNDTGNKDINDRALYIARAPARIFRL